MDGFSPEVIILPKVGVNITVGIFTAESLAQFHRLNVADYFHQVVLQDVAFTFQAWIMNSSFISPWMAQVQFAGPETHSSHGVVVLEIFRVTFC